MSCRQKDEAQNGNVCRQEDEEEGRRCGSSGVGETGQHSGLVAALAAQARDPCGQQPRGAYP